MMEMPCLFSDLISLSRIGRRTASVFPDPVGAIRRMLPPAMIFGIATVCGGVGDLIPDSASASRIGSERL